MSSSIRPYSRRLFFGVLFLLVLGDFVFLALHPAYRYYRRHSELVERRLSDWETGFKRDYISAIERVAVALTNRPPVSSSSSFPSVLSLPSSSKSSSSDVPLYRPLDLSRRDYRYFEVAGVRGFSLSGSLVFRVGDSFLGRSIVSADRFGAVLSDGGVIRLDLAGSNPPDQKSHDQMSKELAKNVK